MSRPSKAWMLAGGAAVVYLLAKGAGKPSGGKYSFGGQSNTKLDRDPSHLLKGFADKLEIVFQRMRARGFDPVLWEGYRTHERAGQLAKRGTGVKDSMHELGAAADIVDRKLLWNAPKAFWDALREEGERVGLVSGAAWSRDDFDHLQAVKVKDQNAFRAMNRAQRELYVA